MRQRFRHSVLTVLMSLPSAQVYAAPPTDDSIVVTGDRVGRERQQAESYVREVGIGVGEQPTARWIDPVCPHAIGLSKENAKVVEERIRNIVVEVGAPLAKRGCLANFNVVFTDSAEAVVRLVARRDDTISRELPTAAVQELTGGAAPIRWWFNSEMRTRDGAPAMSLPFLPGVQVQSDSGVASLPSGRSGSLSLYSPSLVSNQLVRSIQLATVVVDVRRSQGVLLSSVVDYAALVGLAEIRLGATPPRSVLSLFQPNGERRLTSRDRAFLTGLYEIAMDRRGRQQRQALVSKIVNQSRTEP